jgi:superfamily II DNA/RNA helicase
MERFRRHQIDVLVATDLAARGIDVSSISHIINFDIPPDPQVYVHRIGRTARMGEFGRAISLTTREEGKQLTQIEVLINKEIPEIKYDGFQPRPPREEEKKHEPRPASRFDAPAFGSGIAGEAAAPTAPPKTLGSKFRTRRRR